MKYRLGLALLCVVMIGVGLFISQNSQQQGLWSEVKFEQINRVSLQSGFQSDIELELNDSVWQLSDGQKVRQDYVLRLLDDLLSMQQVRLVSHDHDHDKVLGLQYELVHIQCLDAAGKILFSVDVGKQASDLVSTYVRLGGQDQVISVNKTLVWQVRRRMSAWLNVLPASPTAALEEKI
ncbi:MAG: DUF4340 domain-containing protein [Mariprofundaceae bacterium]